MARVSSPGTYGQTDSRLRRARERGRERERERERERRHAGGLHHAQRADGLHARTKRQHAHGPSDSSCCQTVPKSPPCVRAEPLLALQNIPGTRLEQPVARMTPSELSDRQPLTLPVAIPRHAGSPDQLTSGTSHRTAAARRGASGRLPLLGHLRSYRRIAPPPPRAVQISYKRQRLVEL